MSDRKVLRLSKAQSKARRKARRCHKIIYFLKKVKKKILMTNSADSRTTAAKSPMLKLKPSVIPV